MSRNWGRIIHKKEKQRTGTEETGAEAGILCLFFLDDVGIRFRESGFTFGQGLAIMKRGKEKEK